jgi:hypothetical protein
MFLRVIHGMSCWSGLTMLGMIIRAGASCGPGTFYGDSRSWADFKIIEHTTAGYNNLCTSHSWGPILTRADCQAMVATGSPILSIATACGTYAYGSGPCRPSETAYRWNGYDPANSAFPSGCYIDMLSGNVNFNSVFQSGWGQSVTAQPQVNRRICMTRSPLGPTKSVCNPCPNGKFRSHTSHGFWTCDDCTGCPSGKHWPHPSDSGGIRGRDGEGVMRRLLCDRTSGVNDCVACGSGTHQPVDGFTGLSCKTCGGCNSGSSHNGCSETGTVNCIACPVGRYISADNHKTSTCIACTNTCSRGQSYDTCSSTTGEAVCSSCALVTATCLSSIVGSYNQYWGSSSTSAVGITGCKYQSASNHQLGSCISCSTCGAGMSFVGCSITTGTRNFCLGCPTGRYETSTSHHHAYTSATRGCTECGYCGSGKYYAGCSPTTGDMVCIACATDKYQESESHRELACIMCPTCSMGKFYSGCSPTTGEMLVDCKPCSSGQFQLNPEVPNNHRDRVCKICSRGKWQTASEASECIECAPGRYGNRAGMDSNACIACVAGRYAVAGKSECSDCWSGKYTTLAMNEDRVSGLQV